MSAGARSGNVAFLPIIRRSEKLSKYYAPVQDLSTFSLFEHLRAGQPDFYFKLSFFATGHTRSFIDFFCVFIQKKVSAPPFIVFCIILSKILCLFVCFTQTFSCMRHEIIIKPYKHRGIYAIIWKRCTDEYKKNIYSSIFHS